MNNVEDDQLIEAYLNLIKSRLSRKKNEKYTGNVDVKFNFKEGVINNINFGVNESIKL